MAPDGGSAFLEDEVDDGVAVGGEGEGFAEFALVEGRQMGRVGGEIEGEEVVFERWTEVDDLGFGAALEIGDGFGSEAVQQMDIAGGEAGELEVFVGEEMEFEAIEIGEAGLPVVGVAFDADGFAGAVFLEAEWAEADDFRGGVLRDQASRSLPDFQAASSLCLGSMAMESKMRSAAA